MKDRIAIGVDVGGTNIVVAVVKALDYSDAFYHTIPYKFTKCTDSLAQYIYTAILEAVNLCGFNQDDIKNIGLAFPGSLDTKNGIVNYAYNLKIHDAKIADAIHKLNPYSSIKLINDADAATLAEHSTGALFGSKYACLITLGTGLGAGLIINGELFLGGMLRGVELGHMILNTRTGTQCTCGNYGCVETLCNAKFLTRGNSVLSAKQVVDLAKKSDSAAKAVFDEYVDNLSSAIASIINLLDLEKIALGGGISLSGDFLLKPLRSAVAKKCFFDMKCELLLSKLQDKAGALGAAIHSL